MDCLKVLLLFGSWITYVSAFKTISSQSLFLQSIKKVVETSDPLVLEEIDANLPDVRYRLHDPHLCGLKDCVITNMNICESSSTFNYYLECPHIVLDTDYHLQGIIGDMFVEGDGTAKVTLDDYVFKIDGKLERVECGGKEYARIKSYFLVIEARGNVCYDLKNLFDGKEQGKSVEFHEFANKNWKDLDKALRPPVFNNYMDLFMRKLNEELENIPIGGIFPELS
ncbi:uncharacterized protein LOC142984056 [Anticarsia gemmatalis]|uniref:uncharacterized protein LOC142984056 n=1 Tax=Anticarsia gemmatalis TaxID=129554 RepID=UPI003F766480